MYDDRKVASRALMATPAEVLVLNAKIPLVVNCFIPDFKKLRPLVLFYYLMVKFEKTNDRGGFYLKKKNVGYHLNEKCIYMLWENLGKWAKFYSSFVDLSTPITALVIIKYLSNTSGGGSDKYV